MTSDAGHPPDEQRMEQAWQAPVGAPQAWGSMPPPPPPLRGLGHLATPLIAFSGLVVLVDIGSALTASSAIDAYEQAVAEGRDPSLVLTAHDAIAVASLLALVPAWIFAGLWLARARSNAAILEPEEIRRSAAWTFLGWIVPVVSLWFPKQIVDDSWRVTARAAGHQPGRTGVWWAAWVAYLLLGNLVTRTSFSAESSSTTQGVSPGLEVAVAIVSVIAFVAWVPVVRGLTRTQEELVRTTTGQVA